MNEKEAIKVFKPEIIYISSNAPINSKFSEYSVLNYALDNNKKDLAHILLKGKCRVNSNNSKIPTDTPLHKAVRLGDEEIVKKLVTKGASLVNIDLEGNTALHLAFILNHTKIVTFFLKCVCKRRVYKNLKNKQGLTYLHIACSQKYQFDIVKGLLNAEANIHDRININSPYWPGYTPLQFAIEFKVEEAAEALVQADRKSAKDKLNDSLIINYVFHQKNNRDMYNRYKELTNFHFACMKENPGVVERYIDVGVELNIPLSKDVTLCPLYFPLHFAVEGNCKKNVELLLKSGAMVDMCNALKMTPLHLAFYHQYGEIVDLLWIAHKENLVINRKDFYLLSYLHIAVAKNELDIVKKFCDSGEDVNAQVLCNSKNFSYYSPLHFAVKYQHLEMTQFLIDRGAKMNISYNNTTPLHLAIEASNKAFIDLLLRNGSRVDDTVRNEFKQTVLHVLVLKNDLKILEYAQKFVELGCDINTKDSTGNTALHLACLNISEGSSFIKILLDLGADINIKNFSGCTPMEASDWECNDFHDVLCCHIKKLNAIGAKICSNNEQTYMLTQQLNRNDLEFMKTDNQIKLEIERMKNIKLGRHMPLFDFLLLEPNRVATYVMEDDLKWIIEDEKLMERYPMYGYLIKLQFKKGTQYLREMNRQKRSCSVEILEEVISKRRVSE